ncbi:MAG: hypothetical protein CVU41_02255 [Chloroflexi bacterium HGW-Chloroflexi-3]|nr:MAG: hypothetical protein CVU41_02255 [Chloroflexi bacterium HGW-Chloroflexi-3]
MINVIAYVKNIEQHHQITEKLEKIKTEIEFNFQIIDISDSEDLIKKYAEISPYIKVGPYTLSREILESNLRMTILAAKDRKRQLTEVGDDQYQQRIEAGRKITNLDKVSLWLSKSYIWLMIFFLSLYVGLPFLAPYLLKTGAELPANIIYTIYKPLCHQLAFRSWFIFGEQAYYPRSTAGIEGVITYEEISNQSVINIREAQKFKGNDFTGYKVALCQRDVAIYASMLFFGLLFVLSGRRIKSIKWYIWVLIALVPIGFDGVSQLPGLASSLPDWLPVRESNPTLRTITGSLFGFFTAWYLFPLIEESMVETRTIITEKMKYIKSLGQ